MLWECSSPQCFLCSAGLWRGTAAFPPVLQKTEEFPPNVWSVVWCCSTPPPCGPAQTHWFIQDTVITLITKKYNKPPGCSLWAASLISGTQERLWSDSHRGRWNIVPVHQCVVWAVHWTAQPAWTRGVSGACSVRCYTGGPQHLTAQLESAEGKDYSVSTSWKCSLSFLNWNNNQDTNLLNSFNTTVLLIWTSNIIDI